MKSNSSSPETDRQLWSQVCRGDAESFRTIVQRHQSAVTAVAYGVLGDFSACQDVAQEAFWVAWNDCRKLLDADRLCGWLCGIARNLAKQWLRQQDPSTRQLDFSAESQDDPSIDPATATIAAEEADLVWSSLSELPELYREPLVLFYRQSQSVAEVAAALEISADTVRQRLSRGRVLLRDHIAELVGDVLDRSRPGKSFTAKVMAGIVGGTAALKAGTASAAGTAASSVVAARHQRRLRHGIRRRGRRRGGSRRWVRRHWFGTWLPSELAPTMTERDYLRRIGRRVLFMSMLYAVFLLALTPLLFVKFGWILYVALVVLSSIVFAAYVTIVSVRANVHVQKLRQQLDSDADPNPSRLRAKAAKFRGRSFTSRWTLLGVPLIDVQFVIVSERQIADRKQSGHRLDCAGGPRRRHPIGRGWASDRALPLSVGFRWERLASVVAPLDCCHWADWLWGTWRWVGSEPVGMRSAAWRSVGTPRSAGRRSHTTSPSAAPQ